MLKFATRQLDFIPDSAADDRKELLKLKKVLRPKTCPCDCTSTCKACNDLDSYLRNIHAVKFNNHISVIENYFQELHSAKLFTVKIRIFRTNYN